MKCTLSKYPTWANSKRQACTKIRWEFPRSFPNSLTATYAPSSLRSARNFLTRYSGSIFIKTQQQQILQLTMSNWEEVGEGCQKWKKETCNSIWVRERAVKGKWDLKGGLGTFQDDLLVLRNWAQFSVLKCWQARGCQKASKASRLKKSPGKGGLKKGFAVVACALVSHFLSTPPQMYLGTNRWSASRAMWHL